MSIRCVLVLFILIMNLFHCQCRAQSMSSSLLGSVDSSKIGKPKRIASLNLCVDALLLKFADTKRIVSLTQLSENSQFSPFYLEAKPYPKNIGLAEQVVVQNPDLVIAGEFGAAEAKQLLAYLGYPLATLKLPRSLNDISEHIREFGRLTDNLDSTENFALRIDTSLKKLQDYSQGKKPINAFWYASNGVVVGEGTLEHELMQAAGFHNMAAEFAIQGFSPLDLELILQAKPTAIIIESSDTKAYSLANEFLSHPALINSHIKIVSLPRTLSVCIAPIADQVLDSLLEQRTMLSSELSQ